jgi:hypothetical protein
MRYMGQELLNPPTVEGWHQGLEWIDTGTLVERLNFAAEQLGNRHNPGVEGMVDRITDNGYEIESAADLVDACLDQLGAISLSGPTRSALIAFVEKKGGLSGVTTGPGDEIRQRVADVFKVVATSPEFQRA